MIIVSVTYPATEGSRFDLDYYRATHIPLVQTLWGQHGLTEARFLQGLAAPSGPPLALHMTALLSFPSQAAFDAAAQAHGREIMADIRNFTDVRPLVQVNARFE